MADKTTYIKIDRNILSWGWYKNPKVLSVFIWLIIRANIKKSRFEKDTVPRGSLVTSNAHIAEECGLTIDNVRTALANLESTGEITRERRNKYQIITIVNYEAYQSGIIKSGYQIPIKSQSNPEQVPIKSQQYKNIRIKEWEERKKEGTSGEPYPCGAAEKPEWMTEDRWEKIKFRTLDYLPGCEKGFYDSYIEYESEHRGELE